MYIRFFRTMQPTPSRCGLCLFVKFICCRKCAFFSWSEYANNCRRWYFLNVGTYFRCWMKKKTGTSAFRLIICAYYYVRLNRIEKILNVLLPCFVYRMSSRNFEIKSSLNIHTLPGMQNNKKTYIFETDQISTKLATDTNRPESLYELSRRHRDNIFDSAIILTRDIICH